MTIQENDKAKIIKVAERNFEVWMKLPYTVGAKKGQFMEPKDEDFGVWAWAHASLAGAEKCFDEITTGKRGIRPMVEVEQFPE